MAHEEPVKLPAPYEGQVPNAESPPKFVDPFLRYYGFMIHARPAKGDVLIHDGQQWALDGYIHFQPQAIAYALHMHRKRLAQAGVDRPVPASPPAPPGNQGRKPKVNKDPFSEGEAGCQV